MSISSLQLAKKICELSHWHISNLSVQKIIYFCHMFHLGKNNGNVLIDQLFEAWDYGPVLPTLYRELRIFGAAPIESLFFYRTENIEDRNIASLVEDVAGDLVKREPWQLVALTHSKDGAWAKNYFPGTNKSIPNEDILEEYKNKGFEKANDD